MYNFFMKIKIIILSFSIILMINITVYLATQIYSEDKIDIVLKNNLYTLQTHYETLLHTQEIIASTTYKSTINMDRVIQIITKANIANKEQKNILRDELHHLLKEKYKLLQELSILQYQFIFPSNKVFYRAHKPAKYGDDLSAIRADFKYVNRTQKPIRGFTQGRTAHGFRNTFPLFDKNNKHIGAMEISFSSDSFQYYLNHISKIHSHFLVKKYIFDTKTWDRDDLMLHYEQSAESKQYMITLNDNHTKKSCISDSKDKLKNRNEEINYKMSLDNFFSIYIKYNNKIESVSFLPIKNIKNKTVAWIVSYQKSPIIEATLFNSLIIRLLSFFISILLVYFILKNMRLKQVYQSSFKYQRLLELSAKTSSLAFWEFNYRTNTFLVNDLYYKFLATTLKKEGSYEINKEKYLKEFIPKESQKIVLNFLGKAFEKSYDHTCEFEYNMKRRDGEIIPVAINCYISFKNGQPYKSYGTKYNIAEQKKRELEIIDEKEKVKKLLDEQNTLTSIFDKGDAVLFKWKNNKQLSREYVSNSITKLLGYSVEEFYSKDIGYLNLIHKDDRNYIIKEIINCIKNSKDFVTHKPYRIFAKDNSIKWVKQYTATQKNKDGKIEYFISYLNNITDAKLYEKKIENYLELIDKNIISSSTDLDGTIVNVSTAFTELTGYRKDELIGNNHIILRDLSKPKKEYEKLWNTITDDNIWSGEVKNFKKDNSIYWINAKIFPIFDDNELKTGYVAIRQDITDKKELERISIIDELTQLYNRRYFNTIIEDEINRAKRENSLIGFLMLDIDHFKQYNDTYGHQEGDKVICKISHKIQEFASRSCDNAFRLGGEEFGIIFANSDKYKMKEYAYLLIQNIENLQIPHKNNSASKYVTISAGLTFSNDKSLDRDILYKNADELLYKAKTSGRNRLNFRM